MIFLIPGDIMTSWRRNWEGNQSLVNKWRLLPFRCGNAYENMAIDEALFRLNHKDDAPPTVRFYCWEKPTVSLGYFQEAAKEINLDTCSHLGIDLVRRPTGGKAVLHGYDITYAVVAKETNPLFSKDILDTYRSISHCIAEGLNSLGINAVMADEPRKGISPSLKPCCFASPSRYELLVDGKKICGSAQARSQGVFLQHGSLLLDFNARESLSVLKSYTHAPDQIESLFNSVTSIRHCIGHDIETVTLCDVLKTGFEKVLGICFMDIGLTTGEKELMTELLKNKYSSNQWNMNGGAVKSAPS